jgi:hypothetical protein
MMCCAGLRNLAPVTADAFEAACCANAAWLEDVIMHLLCVLALDRFADYVADQVGLLMMPACRTRICMCLRCKWGSLSCRQQQQQQHQQQ